MNRSARRLICWLWLCALSTGALAQSARIVLRWKDVVGTRGYELQIARDSGFVEVVLQTRVPTAAYRWEQLPSSTHWWRVRSFDAEGRPSEWSQPRTVALESTVPVPKTPADDALLPCAQAVELTFESSPLIKEFQIELSSSKDFTGAKVAFASKTATVSLGVIAPGSWYWRARAVDVRDRTGEYAGVRRFTIRPAPTKVKPVADVVLGVQSVTLSWAEVACAASWVVEASSDGKDKVSLPAQGTSLAFKPNAAGEVRWRVAAIDERGTPGDWSAESVFKVRLGTPTPRGESSTPLKLDLAWTPVVGATGYRVELSLERDFKVILTSAQSAAPQLRVSEVAAGRVYWRVVARDDKGHVSQPSEPRPVDVVAPDPLAEMQWLSPIEDLVVPLGAPVHVAWQPVERALYYELEIDEAIAQVPAVEKLLTDLPEGAHVLRIRAKGNSSRVSAWSEPREVYVGVPPVSRVEVTTLAEGLKLVFRDGKGRPVMDIAPRLSVEKGAVTQPVARAGFFLAEWSPPSDGEDVLRVEERDFVTELDLERKLPALFSAAARVGGLFNFSSVASPTATVGLTVRLPVLSRRLGVEARLGVYQAAQSFEVGRERVDAQAWVLPVSVLIGWYQPIGAFLVRGGIGPAFQVALLSVAGATERRVVGDLELAVGVGRQLGPGLLEVEISGLFGALDGQLARLATGGLGLKVGYAFDLGGR